MIATTDNRYSLFGGVLRTSLELPELHPVMLGADENWTLTVHDDVPAPSTAFPWSADEELAGGISIRLERAPDGVSRPEIQALGGARHRRWRAIRRTDTQCIALVLLHPTSGAVCELAQ